MNARPRTEERRRGGSVVLASAVLLAFELIAVANAQAQPRAEAEPFAMRWDVDLPVMIASGVFGSAWLLRDELGPASCAPKCDRDQLAAFDRIVAGRYD